MSRPPRPESTRPLRADLAAGDGPLDYLPLDFRDLVDLAARIGGAVPDNSRDPTATLYELSALVAHVLGVHQDHIASEAFLGTATTARSLVKHGRRLGYEPAPGSTATGYLAIDVKPGLSGELPKGLVAATSPAGGSPAQDFQTAVTRRVDAAWNRLEVRAADRVKAVEVATSATSLRLAGTGLGLRAGDPTILIGPNHRVRLDVSAVTESGGETVLTLATAIGADLGATDDPIDYEVASRPALEARLFGWSADAGLFPPSALETATGYTEPGGAPTVNHGYEVTDTTGTVSTTTADVFVAPALTDSLVGDSVLVLRAASTAVIQISSQHDAAVRFIRGGWRDEVTAVDPETGDITWAPKLDERAITGTVTRLRSASQTRASVGIHSRLYGQWRITASLVARDPSSTTIAPDQDLYVEGEHAGLEPGMVVALATPDGTMAQVVELTEVAVTTAKTTRLRYKERTAAPLDETGAAHVWTKGELVVHGNVIPLVHGVTRDDVLGESDGVTPFQRWKLKKAPLAFVASGNGVTPDLEVRVGGVRWELVDAFGVPEPDPTARHYKLERDHDGTTWVRFGDGRSSAVPPAGRNNVTAHYRVGLGGEGNVAAGRVTRLMKSHPLVDRVRNPVETEGGTAPAAAEDVRRQATRHIRTFDRAVSIRDHADLALLFPGVARATARLADGAIELVAADSEGGAVPNQDLLLEFLDARRDTALRLVPRTPQALLVSLRVYVEIDEAFLIRDVEAAVRDALFGTDPAAPGMFTFATRDLGQAAHASEVYERLARVDGVSFVQLVRFDLSPGTALRDVIQPHPHQWLKVDATSLTFAPKEEADHD